MSGPPDAGLVPATSTFLALYYLLTGAHALHVLGGMLVTGYLASRAGESEAGWRNRVRAVSLYWYFVDVVWICIFVAFYIG